MPSFFAALLTKLSSALFTYPGFEGGLDSVNLLETLAIAIASSFVFSGLIPVMLLEFVLS